MADGGEETVVDLTGEAPAGMQRRKHRRASHLRTGRTASVDSAVAVGTSATCPTTTVAKYDVPTVAQQKCFVDLTNEDKTSAHEAGGSIDLCSSDSEGVSGENEDRKMPAKKFPSRKDRKRTTRAQQMLDGYESTGSRKRTARAHSDEEIAWTLQMREGEKSNGSSKRTVHAKSDEELAQMLQMQEEDASKAYKLRSEKETAGMVESSVGRAWTFVNELLTFVAAKQKEQGIQNDEFAAISVDDMVPMTEALLELQENFRQQNKPTAVNLGVHYTGAANLESIKNLGLLNKGERESRKINSGNNGESHGRGIYTADGISSTCGYGDTGLIVLRLPGTSGTPGTAAAGLLGDSFVGGGWAVLRNSSQCVPVVKFKRDCFEGLNPAGMATPSLLNKQIVVELMVTLQKQVVDKYFNVAK